MNVLSNGDDLIGFIPSVDIIKGTKEKSGRMIVEGVGSTIDRDVDGEILDPNGFDTNVFMSTGFINWHHATQDNPGTVIGEPIDCYVKENKFFVKGELYNFQPLAVEVYNLIKSLNKSPSKRKLGWSIEGKKMQIGADKSYISKSLITGIAITPMPKNIQTWADISKGFKYDVTEALIDNISKEVILDIVKGDKRIIVDKNFNIKTIEAEKIEEKLNINIDDLMIIKKGIDLGMINPFKIDELKRKVKDSFGNF